MAKPEKFILENNSLKDIINTEVLKNINKLIKNLSLK